MYMHNDQEKGKKYTKTTTTTNKQTNKQTNTKPATYKKQTNKNAGSLDHESLLQAAWPYIHSTIRSRVRTDRTKSASWTD